MSSTEVRLYRTRGAGNYDRVPVDRTCELEVWTKGSRSVRLGEVTIEGDRVMFLSRLAKMRAAPKLDAVFSLVEDVTSTQSSPEPNMQYYRIRPRGIGGLWPAETNHFTYGDEQYQRAEVFVFAE